MKKVLAFALAVAVTLMAGCMGSKPKETAMVDLTISEVAHSVFYAPQYVAMEMGFFKDEGLNISLITGQGADKVMTSVLSGEVDIGLAGPEASIYVYNQGKEDHPVIFAQLTKRDGSFLVGREKPDAFTWDKLKGSHVIGGRKGGVPNMTLEYLIKQKGLNPQTDMNMDTGIQFALMAGAFTGGQGDYVALFEPTASMVENEGKGYVLASIGQETGEIPYTAYFAPKSYLTKNQETVEKFTRALYKGQKWVQQNDAKTVAQKMITFFPDTSPEILERVVKRYQEIDAWSKDPVMTEESLKLLQKVMATAGELDKEAPYDQLVDNSFAKKAMEQVK